MSCAPCGSFSLWPQAVLVYAHRASRLCFLCLRALSFKPAGSRLLYIGPLPDFVDLMIGYIDCLAHDMLSCSILNIAQHLEPQNRDYSLKYREGKIEKGDWKTRLRIKDWKRNIAEMCSHSFHHFSSILGSPMDSPMDGRTRPLIKIRERI